MTELQGLRAWWKFLRGSRREGIIRFYAPFHSFRSSHYCLSTKAEKQIIIVNNNLLFHFSQLLFHSLKTIKAIQNNGTTQKQYKNQMFNLSLLGCIWKIPNRKKREELCAKQEEEMRPIFPEISWIFQSEG